MKQFVLLAGGLGNQLFQYSAAVSHGASTVVFIDFTKNQRRDNSGKPEIMSLKFPVPVEFIECPSDNCFVQKFFFWLLGSSARPLSLRFRFASSKIVMLTTSFIIKLYTQLNLPVVLENRMNESCELQKYERSFFFIGYFQSLDYTKTIYKDLKILSMPGPSKDFVDYFKMIERECVIGMHVRRGDYVGHPTFGNLSNDYFKEALVEIWTPNIKVIIFSDSNIVVEEFVPEKILPFTIICPSTFTGIEVLWLMSRCRDLIMSNSSLSWWSAFFGQKMDNRAYAPTPWFKSEFQSSNFYHPKWILRSSDFVYD